MCNAVDLIGLEGGNSSSSLVLQYKPELGIEIVF